MTDAIGGYFGLADRDLESGHYPVDGVRVNTARTALEYILRQLSDVKTIYLPVYTCEAIIEPLQKLSLSYHFYHINMNLEIAEDIPMGEGVYVIVNNYFGLKDAYVARMARKYGEHLIVDNAQALFAPALPDIKAIYSARKFVGVADGGFAIGVSELPIKMYEEDTTQHDSHLLIRKEYGAEAGFQAYRQNEKQLDNLPIRRMAAATGDILTHIDYNKVIARRRINFKMLHEMLGDDNRLPILDMNTFVCPMVYPFLPKEDKDIRNRLIKNKIYVARYWQNVLSWCNPQDIETKLAKNLIPLPIDQRYDEQEMRKIIKLIKNKDIQ